MFISRGIIEPLRVLPMIDRDLTSISRPSSDVSGTGGSGYVDSRNCAILDESMIYVSVGMWWMAGTVYLDWEPVAVLPGVRPLISGQNDVDCEILRREEITALSA